MNVQADQTVEIKARCTDHGRIRKILEKTGAEFRWETEQSDTFYVTPTGRLKLRRYGNVSQLIGYERPDVSGPKHCRVNLCPVEHPDELHRALAATLGVRITVRKRRTLFTLDNIRFHLDRVEGLGDFMEIEVLGVRGRDSVESLRTVCGKWMQTLEIASGDLVEEAYADLLDHASSD